MVRPQAGFVPRHGGRLPARRPASLEATKAQSVGAQARAVRALAEHDARLAKRDRGLVAARGDAQRAAALQADERARPQDRVQGTVQAVHPGK